MFDTKKVAKNVKNARTKMNMTQMNLADEMGVSYQVLQGGSLNTEETNDKVNFSSSGRMDMEELDEDAIKRLLLQSIRK